VPRVLRKVQLPEPRSRRRACSARALLLRVHQSVALSSWEGFLDGALLFFSSRKEATLDQEILDLDMELAASPGPRITPEQVEAAIFSTYYFTAAQGVLGKLLDDGNDEDEVCAAIEAEPALELLTFCVLVLNNGFTVTGQSACAAPENFDADIGREIARRDAVAQIWPLLGYELRTALCEGNQ